MSRLIALLSAVVALAASATAQVVIDYEIVDLPFCCEPPGGGGGGGGQSPDDSRLIHWTHGFMGDRGSWSSANEYVLDNAGGPARLQHRRWPLIHSAELFGYTDDPGVGVAARDLEGQLNRVVASFDELESDNHIMIAHSFGGLATRQLYRNYLNGGTPVDERVFGGLVTFGTPHRGAALADNAGDINAFVTRGCGEVAAAWLVDAVGEFEPAIGLSFQGLLAGTAENISTTICETVGGTVLDALTAPITRTQAVADLRPNSRALRELNVDPEARLRKQTAYGVETEEDLWWIMADQFLSTSGVNNDAGPDFPNANAPVELVAEVAAMQAEFRRRGDLWQDRRDRSDQWWKWPRCYNFWNGRYYTCNWMENLRDAYWGGASWLREADFEYKQLAGFFEEVEREVVVAEFCRFPDGSIDWDEDSQRDCGIRGGRWEQITRVDVDLDFIENDGVVTRESATAFGDREFRMEGSNHFSMRNDSNTDNALDHILGGNGEEFFDCTEP